MLKLEILKELATLRALTQRKRTLTKVATVMAVAYLLLVHGRGGMSYLSTASRMLKDKMRVNVPMEFELERARTMISDLIPDVRKNMLLIAEEEVGVETVRQEVEKARSELKRQREEITMLRKEMDNGSSTLRLANRPATRDEIKQELSRRFTRYQVVEATVAAKEQLLLARDTSLAAARAKLDNMLNAKRDLEVQVENLASRLRTQQSRTVASALTVDDTQLARCTELINGVRIRLEVADRLLAANGDVGDAVSTSLQAPTEDIGDQIDRYFADGSSTTALADAGK